MGFVKKKNHAHLLVGMWGFWGSVHGRQSAHDSAASALVGSKDLGKDIPGNGAVPVDIALLTPRSGRVSNGPILENYQHKVE